MARTGNAKPRGSFAGVIEQEQQRIGRPVTSDERAYLRVWGAPLPAAAPKANDVAKNREAFRAYYPPGLEQRPPMEVARPFLHDLLDDAITTGYVSGSVGATEAMDGPTETFYVEVSFKIVRKTPENTTLVTGLYDEEVA